jgi:DNA invertase Pin-like site-specific DNA recombinase
MTMRTGYARVSTADQSTQLQQDSLRAAGCERVYSDEGVSGAKTKRPQLDRCLKSLQAGDVLVVWKLDRLGRSLAHLIEVVADLQARGVGFVSVTEAIDTTTPQGTLLFHLMGALAQFERSLIAERVTAGRKAAQARGVRFGPRPKLSHVHIQTARQMHEDGRSVAEIARTMRVHRATLYRALEG